ncbi:MAG: NAD(P)/FAD-dependent oxidoreductase [Clostridiales bacterium]|nr:NAD(P)/FAD-dependent oxidoreductase [Clostridiales bacterium]
MSIYDVVIIGAGVAGSNVGYLLGDDFEVLTIERSKELKLDSGIVSNKIFDLIRLPDNLIKLSISKMEFRSPSDKSFFFKSRRPFAYILKRLRFGKWLRNRLQKRSKIINSEFLSLRHRSNYVEVRIRDQKIKAKVLVGADGALSSVRNSLGILPPRIAFGVMMRGPKSKLKHPVVWFNKKYSNNFFAWFSPHNEYGLMDFGKIRERILNLSADLNLAPTDIYVRPIPIGVTKTYSKRVILVGDAAGQVKPMTGGGIIFSLLGSKIATDVVREFLGTGDFTLFREYEKRWKRVLYNEIRVQLLLRSMYSTISNKKIDALFQGLKLSNKYFNNFEYDRIITILKEISIIDILKLMVRLI